MSVHAATHRETLAPGPLAPLVTVIIPAYNEAPSIARVHELVANAPYAKEVIVVDDGSSDGTSTEVERWRASGDHPVVLLRHLRNRGKGAAVRTGLAAATAEFELVQDADLEYDPRDYPLLVEPLLQGAADVVYGSRYLRPGGHRWSANRAGVCMLNFLVWLLYGRRLTDEATCYKAFRTDDLRRMHLECDGFEFCPEVTAKACRMDLRLIEVPVRYDPRSRREGKKIRWRDGVAAVRSLWRWRRWEAAQAPLGSNATKQAPMALRSAQATRPDRPTRRVE